MIPYYGSGAKLDFVRFFCTPGPQPILTAMSSNNGSARFVPGETATLGLDPSMTSTGYAVLRGETLIGAGKIQTKAHQPEPERIWIIFSEVLHLIREFQVSHVAIEEFTAFYRNRRPVGGDSNQMPASVLTALRQTEKKRRGQHDRDVVSPRAMYLLKAAQTATQMAALIAGCDLFLYKVNEWKGGQKVSKEFTIERAQLLYRVKTRDHNITDAIMIAHHHVHRGRFNPNGSFSLSREELRETLEALGTGMCAGWEERSLPSRNGSRNAV